METDEVRCQIEMKNRNRRLSYKIKLISPKAHPTELYNRKISAELLNHSVDKIVLQDVWEGGGEGGERNALHISSAL